MSANASVNAKPANAPAANAPAANAKPGFFNGLFGAKKNAPVNVGARSEGNTNSNAAIAETLQKAEMNKAKAAPSFLPAFLGGKSQAQKNAEKAAPTQANVVSSLNALAAKRARTRKQRGGYVAAAVRRDVLRVTGKTVRKLRNVGVYGLKKVGNGVHMITGLLGAGTQMIGSVVSKGGKTLKGLGKRRQQTRRRS
jgi:hypothetical protein